VKNGPSAHFVGDDLTSAARRDQPTVDSQGHELDEAIEGLVLKRLAPLADHRGSLVPFLDARDEFWSEPVVYGYEIMIRPGRIKGWGMHELQTDRYLVANGKIRVVLYDGRTDHESHGRIAQFFFTEATPGLLAIPPGVWHADQNWGDTDARIVNFPTHPLRSRRPGQASDRSPVGRDPVRLGAARRLRLLRVADLDEPALSALAESDRAGALGEDRVVAADARAVAGAELRAALAQDDHPGLDFLTGEDLHAEHLRVRVAPVARRAETFLVSH
jgi:dTDP-4-dehydrorhamnose 3,5-epimerase